MNLLKAVYFPLSAGEKNKYIYLVNIIAVSVIAL